MCTFQTKAPVDGLCEAKSNDQLDVIGYIPPPFKLALVVSMQISG